MSPSGASVTFGADAVSAGTTITLCTVVAGRAAGQRSEMFELTISPPARAALVVTLPVDDGVVAADVEQASSATSRFQRVATSTVSEGSATFSTMDAGFYRLTTPSAMDGAAPIADAGIAAEDVNRPDAPRAIGPVVVGPDLAPARYDCLGADAIGGPGPAVDVDVEVRALFDQVPRARASLVASPVPRWDQPVDCTTCPGGTTDDAGHVTMALAPGRYWIYVGSSGGSPTYDLSEAWIAGVPVASGARSLVVSGVTIHDDVILRNLSQGLAYAVGRVLDCDARAVQRAEVRIYDARTGAPVALALDGGPAARYASHGGLPIVAADRTALDGSFLALRAPGSSELRLEAWGRRSADASDELLGCQIVSLDGDRAVVADLLPLSADASPGCGTSP